MQIIWTPLPKYTSHFANGSCNIHSLHGTVVATICLENFLSFTIWRLQQSLHSRKTCTSENPFHPLKITPIFPWWLMQFLALLIWSHCPEVRRVWFTSGWLVAAWVSTLTKSALDHLWLVRCPGCPGCPGLVTGRAWPAPALLLPLTGAAHWPDRAPD